MTCRAVCLLYVLYCVKGFALQPPIAYSAASGGGGLAPGSIVALYFFDGPKVSDSRLVSVRLQPEGSTQIFACRVLRDDGYSVWAVLPAEALPGAAGIILAIDGTVFPSTSVTLATSALAIFSVSQFANGWGALAQNLDSLGAPSLNRLTNPALDGQYVTLWGTGLGNLTTADVTVDLASERIPAYFAGHSPGIPGMDQTSFRIPPNTFDGCYVPLVLRAAGTISNQVTIAKASAAGTCIHPLGLSAGDLKTLDEGGAIPFGSVSVWGGISVPYDPTVKGYFRQDSLIAILAPIGAVDIALLSGSQSPASSGRVCQLLANGAFYGSIGGILTVIGGPLVRGTLAIAGPAGQRLAVDGYFGQYFGGTASAEPASRLDQLPPPFFSAGAWTLRLTGDSTVTPFEQVVQLPPTLKWTNRDLLTTISRTVDTAITWDPTGYSPTDVASVALSVGGPAELECRVLASADGIILPRSLLEQLVPTADGLLRVQISSDPQARRRFNVQPRMGLSMPVIFQYGFGETLRVAVK